MVIKMNSNLLSQINDLLAFLFLLGTSVFIYLSVECLIPVKKKWWCRLLLFISCYLLLGMIIFIGDIANMPPTLLFFLTAVWVTCEGSGYKRLTIGMMIATTVFALNAFHDNCFYYYAFRRHFEFYLGPYMRGTFAFILYLCIRRHRPEQTFELSKPLWKLLLVLTLVPFGTESALILLRSPNSINMGTLLADSLLFLTSMLAIIGLLWAMLVLNRQQKLEQENALAQHNQKYYEAMEQQHFEIRRLKHDLANHLQVLASLPETQRTSYIEGMLDNPTFSQVLTYSGDTTVNAVLTAKESLMRQKHIRFHARVEIPNELPFARADICALFANALDNAVEACGSLPAELREITLEARTGKGLLAVSVKNPCSVKEREPLSRKGKALPKTTKTDTANHGFGLQSIRKAARKYNGNMEITQTDQQFILFVYIPLE